MLSVSTSYDVQKTVYSHFSNDKELIKTHKNIIKYCVKDVLNHLCCRLDENSNHIILDTRYFKFIASKENYLLIIEHISRIISTVLKNHETVVFHSNLQTVTLTQVDKHFELIKNLAERLMLEFPDKLDACYIYNAPYLFSTLFNIVSAFIDKKTLKKIKLIE
jgi:uncharacterized protein YaaR (DUF327 family)